MALKSSRVLLVLAIGLVGLAGRDAWQLMRIRAWNEAIVNGSATSNPRAPAEVRFAAAYALGKQGQLQAALNVYREVENAGDAELRVAAKYNSGNLYLEQAVALGGARAEESRVFTLVELAKQSYRELLRERSEDWDARYNLERALRVAPDPDEETEGLPPPPGAERASTTMRGSTLGLP